MVPGVLNSSKCVCIAQGESTKVRPKLVWERIGGLFGEVTFWLRLKGEREQGTECPGHGMHIGDLGMWLGHGRCRRGGSRREGGHSCRAMGRVLDFNPRQRRVIESF